MTNAERPWAAIRMDAVVREPKRAPTVGITVLDAPGALLCRALRAVWSRFRTAA